MDRVKVLGGVVGGLIGAVVFAAVLQSFGRIASVGRVVGAEEAAVGWLVLLVVFGVLGVVYAATFGRMEHRWSIAPLLGLAHGAVWWVILILIFQPLITGSAVFTPATWTNLIGYLVAGLLTGIGVAAATQRTSTTAQA